MAPESDSRPAEKSLPEPLEESLIETPEELDAFIGRVRSDQKDSSDPTWFAVDTEADSMHSHETKLCLIQFASESRLAIFDPLALPDESLHLLVDLLDEAEVVWMHGADYDMAMFRKTFGRIPSTIWDTQTAARLNGVKQFGLANLIENEFGVKLSKQSQKADWGRRPLPEKMLRYAFNDVRFILSMARGFVRRLEKTDRMPWFVECCAFDRECVENREEKPTDEMWRINGWGKLQSRGLAFLKALWYWRDDECRRLDRPAFKLISNQELLSMATKLQEGDRVDPPKYLRPQFSSRLIKTISEARTIPESEWPRKFRPNGGTRLQIDDSEMNRLRDRRNQAARRLGIDPTLIAPRSVLEKLAASNIDEAEKIALLLDWQRELIH